MIKHKIKDVFSADWVLTDGAMGTNLFLKGLETGASPEEWNIDQSKKVGQIHDEFIQAGSQIILTNSFVGSSARLKLHGLQKRVGEINSSAADIARNSADKSIQRILVAGSVGPTGELFEPLGTLKHSDAVEIFHEQIDALANAGVDIIWIETLSAIEEMRAAIEACNIVRLPICCTMSFDTNASTMMGVSPSKFADFCDEFDIFGYGGNCGIGPSEMIDTILKLNATTKRKSHIIAKGNCGIPKYKEGKIIYDGSPEIMEKYAITASRAGAKVIGGCCGTTPNHIKRMHAVLEKIKIDPYSEEEHIRWLGKPWQGLDLSKKRVRRRPSS